MRRLRWLVLSCALVACGSSSTKSKDAGTAGETDAGQQNAGGGGAGEESALEKPPGSLARPPSDKLPDDLKPPGFGK